MIKLAPENFGKAGHLFQNCYYQTYAEAVIAGDSPGELFVDNADYPTAACMATLEPYLLAGNPYNLAFNAALKTFFSEIITQRTPFNGESGLFVHVASDDWLAVVDEVFLDTGRPRIMDQRRYYTCQVVPFDWRASIPASYSVRRVNAALLADSQIDIPPAIVEWADHALVNWPERLPSGFGACTLNHHQIVSWSLYTCVAGNRCEVLIDTKEPYRRRGLATLTAAALVEFSLADGFTEVGWDCSTFNVPSWKAAERAGFKLVRQSAHHYCMFEMAAHWFETGWIAFREARYQAAVTAYEQSFHYHAPPSAATYQEVAEAYARLGNHQKAAEYQQRA